MSRAFLFMLTLAALSWMTGCAALPVQRAYEGPARPGHEVATIRYPYQVELLSVNGAAWPGLSVSSGIDRRAVEVLPGDMELLVRFTDPYEPGTRHSDPVLLRFNAEGGRQYEIRVDRIGGQRDPRLHVGPVP